MTEKAKLLKRFVASEGRIHPIDWQKFYKLLVKSHPEIPRPMILGGANCSPMAKRVTLLSQIQHIESDQQTLDQADLFLRRLGDDEWFKSQEPPSNLDSWGKEDVPPLFYLLALE